MAVAPPIETVPGTYPPVAVLRQRADDIAPDLVWLSPAETAFLSGLSVPKRRDDWLLGRWTAKRLVRTVLAMDGQPSDATALTIAKAADGAPIVEWGDGRPDRPPLTVSLSHSHGVAAAALVRAAAWPLGIDLERCEERHPALVADYFTAAEQANVAAWPAAQRTTAVNAIWSGKEAALKAVRLGLAQDTRAVVVNLPAQPIAPADWAPLIITWDAQRLAGPPLAGWWRVVDGFVLTLACGQSARQSVAD